MKVSASDMRAMAANETSLPSRVRYTALLLVATGGACVTGALLATEASLPGRTQAALSVLLGINLAWMGFAVWVLARRRVLLAGHSVVAARMAVGFAAVFVVGAWATGYWGAAGRAMYVASASGVVMLAVAGALLVRARRRLAALVQRQGELEEAVR